MPQIRKQKGATLIEMVVGSSMALLVMWFATSLMMQFTGELRRLSQGVDINSMQIDIQRALMSDAVCQTNFADPFAIDESRAGDPSYAIQLPRLVANTAGTRVLATAGSPMHPASPNITVRQIRAVSVQKTAANSFLFTLEVGLNSADGKHPAPILIPRLRVRTDAASPSTAKRAVACGGVTASANTCRLIRNVSPGINRIRAMCAANEQLISGGGECLTPAGNSWSPTVPFATFGYLRLSTPVLAGASWGWEADCYNESNNVVRSAAYAYCCQI